MTRTWIAVGGALALFLLGAGGVDPASGHSTGHESRVAQCQRLPTPERQNCINSCVRSSDPGRPHEAGRAPGLQTSTCVTRPLKHHFHPDYPPGARCRPDNGKP
jgi:hypothetical protein